jgi:hypothetical protein
VKGRGAVHLLGSEEGVDMVKTLYAVTILLGLLGTANGQTVPKILWGKWIIRRTLPTKTISCWGDEEARKLIGTELEYGSDLFRWQKVVTKSPLVEETTVTARQFHDENSGRGRDSSQVTFGHLGIREPRAVQIVFQHPPANLTGATIEIPGDFVLVKDRNTIIFPVCNVYFEAERSSALHRE